MQWIEAITLFLSGKTLRFHLVRFRYLFLAIGFALTLRPNLIWACACGCSVFDVGTPSLIPNGSGGQVWFEYD
jgi:hypothetical protein